MDTPEDLAILTIEIGDNGKADVNIQVLNRNPSLSSVESKLSKSVQIPDRGLASRRESQVILKILLVFVLFGRKDEKSLLGRRKAWDLAKSRRCGKKQKNHLNRLGIALAHS